MNKSLTISRLIWIVLPLFLVACGAITEKQAASPTATAVATSVIQITDTVSSQPTLTSTPTVLPTETPAPTPTHGKPFTLEDLQTLVANQKRVYVRDGNYIENVYIGNVYIQEGLTQTRQLTHSGQDHDPLLSSDGHEVVFYRGKAVDTVYLINADGSKERLILSKGMFPGFDGDITDITFVSKTHLLLFNLEFCTPYPPSTPDIHYYARSCTRDIYRVNTDSGEKRKIAGGLLGNAAQDHNFEVSPDGRYLAVAASGHVDILDINGEIIRPNAILYRITTPDEFLPFRYWLPDSSGLIALVAVDKYSGGPDTPVGFAVWRYNMGDEVAVQLPFDPSIARISQTPCSFSVSPDRNWIFYANYKSGTDEIQVYLGNLNNGHAQEYKWGGGCGEPDTRNLQWSPDSKHFSSGWSFKGDPIGSVDGSSIPSGGSFGGWIDSNHYYYQTIEADQRTIKTYAAEIGGESILVPTSTPEK